MLELGRRVEFNVAGIDMTGELRFLGAVPGRDGMWAGVQLDRPFARHGRNDGTVAGVRYFDTEPGRGLFLPMSRVSHPRRTNARHLSVDSDTLSSLGASSPVSSPYSEIVTPTPMSRTSTSGTSSARSSSVNYEASRHSRGPSSPNMALSSPNMQSWSPSMSSTSPNMPSSSPRIPSSLPNLGRTASSYTLGHGRVPRGGDRGLRRSSTIHSPRRMPSRTLQPTQTSLGDIGLRRQPSKRSVTSSFVDTHWGPSRAVRGSDATPEGTSRGSARREMGKRDGAPDFLFRPQREQYPSLKSDKGMSLDDIFGPAQRVPSDASSGTSATSRSSDQKSLDPSTSGSALHHAQSFGSLQSAPSPGSLQSAPSLGNLQSAPSVGSPASSHADGRDDTTHVVVPTSGNTSILEHGDTTEIASPPHTSPAHTSPKHDLGTDAILATLSTLQTQVGDSHARMEAALERAEERARAAEARARSADARARRDESIVKQQAEELEAQAANAAGKAEVEALQAALRSATEQLEERDRQLERTESQLQDTEQALDRAHIDLHNKASLHAKQLEKAHKAHEEDAQYWSRELANARRKREADFEELALRAIDLERLRTNAESDLAALRKSTADGSAAAEQLRADLHAAVSEIAVLKDKLTEAHRAHSASNAQLADYGQEFSHLDAENARLKKQILSLQQALDTARAGEQLAQSKASALRMDLDDCRRLIDGHQDEVSRLRRDIAAKPLAPDASVTRLKDLVTALTSDNESLRAQLRDQDAHKAHVKNLEERLERTTLASKPPLDSSCELCGAPDHGIENCLISNDLSV